MHRLQPESKLTEFFLRFHSNTIGKIFLIELVFEEFHLDCHVNDDHRIEENENDDFLKHNNSIEHLQRHKIELCKDHQVDCADKNENKNTSKESFELD